jgi:ATP-dependent helicase/nuclease subunit A
VSSASFELETLRKDWVIKAGAGAGKTTELVKRVLLMSLDYFETEGRFPKIILTTFTRKATQEIKERLAAKVISEMHTLKADLTLGEAEKFKKLETLKKLFVYVSSSSHLQISTIHSVLIDYLSRFASMKYLPPSVSLIDNYQTKLPAKRILREMLPKTSELLQDRFSFSEITELALKYFQIWLTRPHIESLTRAEMETSNLHYLRDRVDSFVDVCKKIEAATVDGKWIQYADLVVKAAQAIDWQNSPSINSSLTILLDKASMKKPSFSTKDPQFSEELHDQFKKERDRFFKLEDILYAFDLKWIDDFENLNNQIVAVLNEFCEKFLALKKATGQLAMGDLEGVALRFSRENPDAAKSFSAEWDYWFIDEFQDTSPLQFEILNYLIGDRKKFIVGDPQQSIYLFRGSRVEVFNDAIEINRVTNGIYDEMVKNYRSQPSVLEFINDFFAQTEFANSFTKMIARSEDFNVTTPSVFAYCPDKQKDIDDFEAAQVKVEELLLSGVSPEDICILSRNNKDLETLAMGFCDKNFPVQLHSSSDFGHSLIVSDAIVVLKFVLNPYDNKSFVELFRSPWFKVEDELLVAIANEANTSFWKSAYAKADSLATNHPFVKIKKYIELSQLLGVGATWQNILVEQLFFDTCNLIDSTGVREANLWKLVQLVRSMERSGSFNYNDFIEELKNTAGTSEGEQQATPVIVPSRVNLMTVHASKGLQFKHVVIIGMNKPFRTKAVPTMAFAEAQQKVAFSVIDGERTEQHSLFARQINEIMTRREQQELDRLLYVACTRAIESLTFIMPEVCSKNTWGAKWPWPLIEGQHERSRYCYLVKKISQPAKPMNVNVEQIEHIPTPLRRTVLMAQSQKVGVTQLAAKNLKISSKDVWVSNIKMAELGTAIHDVFESLKYKSQDWVLENMVPRLKNDAVHEAIAFLLSYENGLVKTLIENGSVEWGFTYRNDDNKWITGKIDLWGKASPGIYWVVDYKTGSSKYSETALQQIRSYKEALRRMKIVDSTDKIHLLALYVNEKTAVTEFDR